MNEPYLSNSVLEEYRNNPELHIKKLKVKLKQIIKMKELFNITIKDKDENEGKLVIQEKIENLLDLYKVSNPEYFL